MKFFNHLKKIAFFFFFAVAANLSSVAQKPISVVLNNPNEICKKCNNFLPKNIFENKIDSVSDLFVKCYIANGYISAAIDSTKSTKDSVFLFVYNGLKYKRRSYN